MGQLQKVCICQLDEKLYGFPIENIIRIIRAVEVTFVPNAPLNTLGVFDYQGTILPLMNIRQRLSLPQKELDVDDRFVLLNSNGTQFAIVVDSVSDVIMLDDKNSSNTGISKNDTALQKVVKISDSIVFTFEVEKLFSAHEIISPESQRNLV
jgi:purine-binding chemotaxis protein CheW